MSSECTPPQLANSLSLSLFICFSFPKKKRFRKRLRFTRSSFFFSPSFFLLFPLGHKYVYIYSVLSHFIKQLYIHSGLHQQRCGLPLVRVISTTTNQKKTSQQTSKKNKKQFIISTIPPQSIILFFPPPLTTTRYSLTGLLCIHLIGLLSLYRALYRLATR